MLIPDPDWKLQERGVRWMPGDTANMSIGQGDVLVTPLQMACFTASVARGELLTRPTLVHRPGQRQQSDPIGLTLEQRAALIEGMAGTITHPKGTGRLLETTALKIPGISLAGKTGTAQKVVSIDGKVGTINLAWFICFAPVEKPEIAMAVMVVGDTIGQDFYGSRHAAPVASAVLRRYFEKRTNPAPRVVVPFRTE
jgi:penicillin-binding protein 2